MNRENDETVTLRAVSNKDQHIKISQEPAMKTLIEVNREMTEVNGGIIINKHRGANGFVDSEGQTIEVVYCRARKCDHNEGNGKCDITRVDDKVSVDEEGRCENYYVKTE